MLTQANLSNEQALGTACAFFAGLQRLLRAHLRCERSPAREKVPWVGMSLQELHTTTLGFVFTWARIHDTRMGVVGHGTVLFSNQSDVHRA